MISRSLGLFPYISKWVLKIFTVNSRAPMMESTRTAMLAASCQAGMSLTPSLRITNTGAVIGIMVSTTQIGLSGNIMSNDMNQRGEMRGIVKIAISCCPSRELALTAPTAADSTAKNK